MGLNAVGIREAIPAVLDPYLLSIFSWYRLIRSVRLRSPQTSLGSASPFRKSTCWSHSKFRRYAARGCHPLRDECGGRSTEVWRSNPTSQIGQKPIKLHSRAFRFTGMRACVSKRKEKRAAAKKFRNEVLVLCQQRSKQHIPVRVDFTSRYKEPGKYVWQAEKGCPKRGPVARWVKSWRSPTKSRRETQIAVTGNIEQSLVEVYKGVSLLENKSVMWINTLGAAEEEREKRERRGREEGEKREVV